ncbi:hypothetical protein PVK06_027377 [Gossypium arboreum]|uniref:Uncharacterized protein n=1 Tax=Gossypium arboreum TaxID=29729 RepID=A0ABR0P0E8_GOSAR|nr:hypothetical protein PVK06_027377 [Gossypium arboreum]
MEWVIRWMQEMTPMGIDYVHWYGMPILKSPPMQFYEQQEHKEGKEEEEEEGVVKEEGEESNHGYDFNNAFLPEKPSVGGIQFRNPSQSNPTQSTRRQATEEVIDHGKDPIIV